MGGKQEKWAHTQEVYNQTILTWFLLSILCVCVDGRELKVADSRIGKETLKTTRLVCVCPRERETVGRPVSSSLGSFFFLFCVLFVFVLCVSFSSWVDSGRRRKVKLRVAGLFRLLLLFFFFFLPDHQPKHRLLLLEFPVRCGSCCFFFCCSRNTRRDELLLLPPFLNDVSLYLYIQVCACVYVCERI